jgi:hypothetical protein
VASEQRIKRARRALIADGWGWETTEEAPARGRARAFPVKRVRRYEDGTYQERSAISVLTDGETNAVLHLARLTGALRRYERLTRHRRAA